MTTWILVGLLIAVAAYAVQETRKARYQQRVLDWVDGWQAFMQPLIQAALHISAAKLPPIAPEIFYVNRRLAESSKDRALDQLDRAASTLAAVGEQMQAIRTVVASSSDEVKHRLKALEKWEKANPVPQKPRWL